jgi:hypothetical protein
MTIRFQTRADAERAGFQSHPRARTIRHDGDYRIVLRDASDYNEQGSRYTLVATSPAVSSVQDGRTIYHSGDAVSSTVWFEREPNKLGRPGCYSIMLDPEKLGPALTAAHQAIAQHRTAAKALTAEQIDGLRETLDAHVCDLALNGHQRALAQCLDALTPVAAAES